MDSILTSVKKLLGIAESYTAFDADIIMHINAVFLVLQQLDGNVIGPKILGNTTGLSSFWVLFAILLFGGLWGFVGMIVGVPLFAVIYDVIKKLVIHGLQRNQELTLLNSYHDQFGDPTDDAAAQPAAPQPAENQ